MRHESAVMLRNLVLSSTYPALFLGFGFCFTLLGPTLTDLAANVGVPIVQIAVSFATRGTISLIISLLLGKILDFFHTRSFVLSHVMLLLAATLCAGTFIAIPLVKQYWLLILLVNSIGLLAVYNLSISFLMSKYWQQKAIVGMNLSQAFFGIGCTMSPLVLSIIRYYQLPIAYAFWTASAINAIIIVYTCVALVFASMIHVFLLKEKLITLFPSSSSIPTSESSSNTPSKKSIKELVCSYFPSYNSMLEWSYFIVCGIAMSFLSGFEAVFGAIFGAYLEMVHSLDKHYISLLYTLYFISLTVTRLVVSYVTSRRHVSSSLLLCFSGAGCVILSLTFALTAKYLTLYWIVPLTLCLGVCFGPCIPCTLSFPASSFIKLQITATRTSLVVVGMSIGSIVVPFVLAHSFATLGMNTFFQLITLVFSMAGCAFIAMVLVSFWHNAKQIRQEQVNNFKSIETPVTTMSTDPIVEEKKEIEMHQIAGVSNEKELFEDAVERDVATPVVSGMEEVKSIEREISGN